MQQRSLVLTHQQQNVESASGRPRPASTAPARPPGRGRDQPFQPPPEPVEPTYQSSTGTEPTNGLTGAGRSGWEVAKRAREIDPEFPIVYMTGTSADDYGSLGVPNSILLNKPFAPAQLVTAVSQLLNTGKPTNMRQRSRQCE
jgi:hypothetical protein